MGGGAAVMGREATPAVFETGRPGSFGVGMAEIAASGRGVGGQEGGAAGTVTAPGPFAYDEISQQTFDSNEVSPTHRGEGRGGKGGPQENPRPAKTQGNNWVSDPLELDRISERNDREARIFDIR